MPADIFISYSRKDSKQALALADRLRVSGVDVWIDQHGIEAATSWSTEIAEALDRCLVFVLLLSAESLASKNVMKELSLAAEAEKHIIPVELESVVLPTTFKYHLAGLQRVGIADFEAIRRALRKLGIAEGGVQPPDAIPALPYIPHDTSQPATLRIAVLPFEDLSPAHDNEWFSDGLTDELISTLNRLDALFVLDRKSSQMYRDAKMTVKQIAKELDVRYVITGAVRKAGEKLRIAATLVDASNGATLWDDKFSGTMEDIFDIQEKTALEIAEGLKLTLTPAELEVLDEKSTISVEAYQLVLRAMELNSTEQDALDAMELCKRAVELDPNYMAAYFVMSISFSNFYRRGGEDKQKWLTLERETIRTMQQIRPNSYYTFGPRANYYLNIGEPELALEMALKAVAARPKTPSPYRIAGFVYHLLGKSREAIPMFAKALEIDPSSLNGYKSILSCYLVLEDWAPMAGWLERARPYIENALELNPANLDLRIEYMNFAEAAGRKDTAVSIARYFLAQDDVTPEMHYNIAPILANNGEFDRGLSELRLAIDSGWSDVSKLDIRWYKVFEGTPEYDIILHHANRNT